MTVALAAVLLAIAGVVAVAAYLQSRDGATLSSAQGPGVRRTADAGPFVRPGNVLLLYSDARTASELRALAREYAGPGPDGALAAAGQAVLVRRRAGLPVAISALSARHRLDAPRIDVPGLRSVSDFVAYWLGRAGG